MRNEFLRGILLSVMAATWLAGCGGGGEAPKDQAQGPAEQVPAGEAPPATAESPAATDPAGDSSAPELRKRLVDSTAAEEEWVPELVPTPLDSTAETLRRASEALAAGRVEQGDNNALSLYLSVLSTDPENAEAKAGVDKIVADLVAKGEQHLTQGRFSEASRLAQVVSKVRADDPAVQAFKAKVDAGREVGTLLVEAQRLAAAGKVVAPEGDNAAEVYRGILRKDAQNAAALQGLAKLESDLLAQAGAAAQAGNYAEADRLLADAGKVRPGSQDVQNAATRIVEMRSGRTSELAQQANAAIDAKDFDRAAELLRQIEQVSAQAQGIDELRARLESARVYASLKPGQSLRDDLSSGGKGPELVVLPVGSFRMGSPDNEADRKANEGPQRTVTINKAFAMGRAEITVDEFRVFVRAAGYTPSSKQSGSSTIYDEKSGSMIEKRGVSWEHDHAGERAEGLLPVIHVSWNDAAAYADWLSKQTGKRYRLPSEAEFEYALRAGSQSRYPWGDGNPTRVVANLTGDKDRSATRRNWVNAFPDYGDGHWGPAAVRSFEPNRFGLHDLAGNVSEWVEDCWHDNYQRAPSDGTAWVNPGCGRRVIRGGSWASAPDQARSAFRLNAAPTTTNPRLGFRVVRDL